MKKEELQKQLEVLKLNFETEAKKLYELINKPETKQTAKDWLEKVWMENKTKSFISTDNCWTFGELPEKWMFQQDLKNKRLYYSYHRIYTVLLKQFKVEIGDIGTLVMEVVGKDIVCEGLTPINLIQNSKDLVGKDIVCDGLTPDKWFDNLHFKVVKDTVCEEKRKLKLKQKTGVK
jgi:hypothetical protein